MADKKKKKPKKQNIVSRSVNTFGRNLTGNASNPQMQDPNKYLTKNEMKAFRENSKPKPKKKKK